MLSQPVKSEIGGNLPGRIQHSALRNKSLFNPQVHNNQHVEVFNKMVLKDLEKLKIKKTTRSQSDPQGY